MFRPVSTCFDLFRHVPTCFDMFRHETCFFFESSLSLGPLAKSCETNHTAQEKNQRRGARMQSASVPRTIVGRFLQRASDEEDRALMSSPEEDRTVPSAKTGVGGTNDATPSAPQQRRAGRAGRAQRRAQLASLLVSGEGSGGQSGEKDPALPRAPLR